MSTSITLPTCPSDILASIARLLEPIDVWNLRLCGESRLTRRFTCEPILLEIHTDSFSHSRIDVSRLVVHIGAHLRVIKLHDIDPSHKLSPTISDWSSSLPPTLTEIDFWFIGSSRLWLRPFGPGEFVHWTLTTPHHCYIPVSMQSRFPNLRVLKLCDSGHKTAIISVHSDSPDFQGLKDNTRFSEGTLLNAISKSTTIEVEWTDFMFGLFVKQLPRSLATLHLCVPFPLNIYTPYLPLELSELELVHVARQGWEEGFKTRFRFDPHPLTLFGTLEATLYKTLTTFRYILPYSQLEAALPCFEQLESLDLISTRILGSQLHLLPRTLTTLSLNCSDFGRSIWSNDMDLISLKDLAKLPRSLLHLRLQYIGPGLASNGEFDIGTLLPPHLIRLVLVIGTASQPLGISNFHLRSICSHLSHLQHFEASHIFEFPSTLDWLPISPSFTSLKLASNFRFRLSDSHFDSFPVPCHLTSLELYGWHTGRITKALGSKLPRTLTELKMPLRWSTDDTNQFLSDCPPSLTRTNSPSPSHHSCVLSRSVGSESSRLSTLTSLDLEPSQDGCVLKAGNRYCLRSHIVPSSITCIQLPGVTIPQDSPLLQLPNLVSLSVQYIPLTLSHEYWQQRHRDKKKLTKKRSLEIVKQLREASIVFSESTERHLPRLSRLSLDGNGDSMESLFWILLCAPLQQRITHLHFKSHYVPFFIDSLLNFCKLSSLSFELLDNWRISDSLNQVAAPLWLAMPRTLAQLRINLAPPQDVLSTLKERLPDLTSLYISGFDFPQHAFSSLPTNITSLFLSRISITHPETLYEGLDRELLSFSDLELLQSLCPSVTSGTPSTWPVYQLCKPISWAYSSVSEYQQVKALKALPPNLTRLVWPHGWHYSLGIHLPHRLMSLEITAPVSSVLDWKFVRKAPDTLQALSIGFDSNYFPKGFTAWLPRSLNSLTSSATLLQDSDARGLPPGLQRLILKNGTLSSTLLSSMSSLSVIELLSISEAAYESLPMALKEFKLHSQHLIISSFDTPLALSYLPICGWYCPALLELASRQLESI